MGVGERNPSTGSQGVGVGRSGTAGSGNPWQDLSAPLRGPWVDLGSRPGQEGWGTVPCLCLGWPGQKWRRESCWYPRQRLLLGIVHTAAAKEVTRHLGGELATFPWDPPGCGAVGADRDRRCFPLPKRQNRGTGNHHVPCYFGPLSPGAPSSVTSLAYFLSFTPLVFLLLCLLCAFSQLFTLSLADLT